MKGEWRQGMAARPSVFNGNDDDVCILSGGLHPGSEGLGAVTEPGPG